MRNTIFSKYHGAGNDFVIIDARNRTLNLTKEWVAKICDRHFGVGADGLMTLEDDPSGTEFYMRYWNSDGGESTMCGNGGRCISLFAHHLGLGGYTKHFNSIDGFHTAQILDEQGVEGLVKLGMIDVDEMTRLSPTTYFANTGSPHYVEFVDDTMAANVVERGREIRNSQQFSSIGGTNVNFVQILSANHIRIRTYERGVESETLACGTGATAAALVTAHLSNSNRGTIKVDVMGGNLAIDFNKSGQKFEKITLSGPASKVFDGVY